MAKPVDNTPEAEEAISTLLKRVDYIEDAFVSQESEVIGRDSALDKATATAESNLKELQDEIAEIKAIIANLNSSFQKITVDLKQSVRKEEIERLTARVDRLNVEKLVTKNSLKRAMKDMEE